ncbi:hypothetical protein DKP76_10445 [Falsochrobactrum shanghaiense]|uniref:Uncharacterized protein n=1 Tax=Falsochrobactrum shanghaiense TaxID=2201899 RepID=A0A316JBL3_9HYPH|nr:hypothetical protein [Falsochrobactrum shanghaiense]PWL18129.1 hypothetical protein DKP76_10445 [Falsochrobactrum shanghaiense]
MADKKIARTQHEQVMDMESPVLDLQSAVSIMNRMLTDNFTHVPTQVTGRPDYWYLGKQDIEDMFFIMNEVRERSSRIKDQWLSALEAGR